jgi:uncharacterized protein YbjT (DUF2867 family)
MHAILEHVLQLRKQLLRHNTGLVITELHTHANSPVIHNLTKQKLSKHLQRLPHHTKIRDKFFWKIHNRIQIEEFK